MKYLYITDIDRKVLTRSTVANIGITIVSFILRNILIQKQSSLAYFVDNFFTILATFIIDVCFVQKTFKLDGKLKSIPYSDIIHRTKYLFDIEIFYKYIIIMIIASIINSSLFRYISDHLKEHNKIQFKDKRLILLRDVIIQVLVNGFSTIMFINIMKFKWAYIDYDDMYLTIIILTWFSLSILISVFKIN